MGRHSRGDDPAHGRPEAGEPTGYRGAAARPGEVVGAFPVNPGSASGYQHVPGSAPGEATGSFRRTVAAPAGSRRGVADGGEVAGRGRGETSGYRRTGQDSGYRVPPGEATGYRVPGETTGHRAPGEATGSRRAVTGAASGYRGASGETTGSRPAVGETSGYRHARTAEAPGEATGSRRVLTVDGRPVRRRAGAGESTGSHRVAPPGEATGSHRVVGETKRGIAKWPIVAGVFVVLLVLGILGWGWADSVLANRAEAQASACAEGDSNLSVIAAPSAAPAVTAAAERWNQAKTVVHAHCVRVQVQAIDDQRVLLALTGRGNLDSIGGQPAVWIPETTATITELTTARSALLTAPAESLVTTATADYPCAVLTAGDVDEVQQRASQVFRNYLQEPAQKADFARMLTPGA